VAIELLSDVARNAEVTDDNKLDVEQHELIE